MNEHCNDLVVIDAAGLLRSFGVGLTGVVLGIYLFRLGLSSFEIGFVIAAGLAGSALATVVTSLRSRPPGAQALPRAALPTKSSEWDCLGENAEAAASCNDGIRGDVEWHGY